MDHLAKQVDVAVGMLFHRFVGDVDRILHAVAKPEMTGNLEPHRPKIEQGGRHIFFARINNLVRIFYFANDRRLVNVRDVEFFTCHSWDEL